VARVLNVPKRAEWLLSKNLKIRPWRSSGRTGLSIIPLRNETPARLRAISECGSLLKEANSCASNPGRGARVLPTNLEASALNLRLKPTGKIFRCRVAADAIVQLSDFGLEIVVAPCECIAGVHEPEVDSNRWTPGQFLVGSGSTAALARLSEGPAAASRDVLELSSVPCG
jgi:hypothetical protein